MIIRALSFLYHINTSASVNQRKIKRIRVDELNADIDNNKSICQDTLILAKRDILQELYDFIKLF